MNALNKLTQAVDAMQDTTLAENDLSLGCDIFDLMVSGRVGAAMGPGRYCWFHGPSGSGKSYYTKVLLAEAANNPAYDDHRLVMFDGENGSNFDTATFFGNKLASRLEHMKAASLDHLYDAMDIIYKKPAIVLVDSWDSWLPQVAIDHIEASAKARADDKDPDGSFGMAHGRIHSDRLRLLVPKLKDTGSILLGVSQHRDNVNKANKYSPSDVVPGGRALKFWCHCEIETRLKAKLEKKIQGTDTQIGEVVTIKVVKNRMNGAKVPFDLEFYPTFGVDNIGSSLRWLTENKYVTIPGGRYKLPFLGEKSYFREDLISHIEKSNLEPELATFLSECYEDWRSQMTVERKSRYE
jgi:hypothetical protein